MFLHSTPWGSGSCFSPQRPEHLFDAALLLFHVGMDVEVEGGADVGMAEEDADGLVVAAALDAAGGEAVAEAVELEPWHAEAEHQFVVVVAVGAGLGRPLGIREDICTAVDPCQERPEHLAELARNRNPAHRCGGLRRADDKFGMLLTFLDDVNALDGLGDVDDAGGKVDVLPFQCADLTDAETRAKAYVNAQVHA